MIIENIRHHYLRNLDKISATVTSSRYSDMNPLHLSLPNIVSLSGNQYEPSNYNVIDYSDRVGLLSTLDTILINTAYKIYKAKPEVENYTKRFHSVLYKPWGGPYNKLPYDKRIVKDLSIILLDPKNLLELEKQGFLDWDNGDYLASLGIAYGWRKIIKKKIKLSQNKKEVFEQAYLLFNRAIKKYPGNNHLKLVYWRYLQSWFQLTNSSETNAINFYSNLIADKRNVELTILAHLSMVDLGIKYKNEKIIDESTDKLHTLLPEANSFFLLAKGWSLFLKRDLTEYKKHILKLKQNSIINPKQINLFLEKTKKIIKN